jgi:hypothetical protein
MQILKDRGQNEHVTEALKRVFYFDDPKDLLKNSGKARSKLYSMNHADFESLYSNGDK